MYLAANAALLASLFCALAGSAIGILQMWNGKTADIRWMEKTQMAVSCCFAFASAVLLYALCLPDFSLEYVASYTERSLPLFYRTTAFWAGQSGSLLFWGLMVSLCGTAFLFTRTYKSLHAATRTNFLVLHLGIAAFFALLLTTRNTPFTLLASVPADGNGLNPLLQNPGMIFHPPLLFLGYGGFVIPGCLALAQALNPEEDAVPWLDAARPFTLTGWLFLTAGIVLGAWWAYMELGWGGYWAWDPVENASLIPWLIGTAALHTGIVEKQRGKLHRCNIFLMSMATASAFLATWLVRGNVVNSVHGYGEGDAGPLLLGFTIALMALSAFISLNAKKKAVRPLAGIETREGFVVLTTWLLAALCLVILGATLWPVISRLWLERPVGLGADFYNSVCLPLFSFLFVLLLICPWLKWQGGLRSLRGMATACAAMLLSLAALWYCGIRKPLPLISAAAGFSVLAGMVCLLAQRSVRTFMPSVMACIVHAGAALIVLGISFSGPYKQETETELAPGGSVQVGPYTVTLSGMREGRGSNYEFIETELMLSLDGKNAGTVRPQRRLYDKFKRSAFSEAATCPSLGREFYVTLLGINGKNAVLRMSSNPGVNWLWIGGAVMSLAPLLGLRRRRKISAAEDIS